MKTDLPLKPNTLYHGDCLDIMREWVKSNPTGCVDLIYLDPPFNSDARYNIMYGKDQTGKPLDERAQFTAFNDTWYWSSEAAERVASIKNAVAHPAHKAICGLAGILPESGMLAYLSYMAERLAVMRDLLKDTGSIYLHCDPTASHYLKAVMDCIFGTANFKNEIVWAYNRFSRRGGAFPSMSDTIFLYWKSEDSKFNALQTAAKDQRRYETGYHTVVDRGIKKLLVYDETKAAHKIKEAKNENIEIVYTDARSPKMGNVWSDISIINPMSKERLDYPTQKPLALLERIVSASSDKGDLVLDPFCGCGTTAEAAWKLGRKFLGIDISPFAIRRVCNDRLKNAAGVSVMGLPGDMQSARDLLKTKDGPFVFEHWVISCLEGFAPNDKQAGDGGIDGRGRLLNPPVDQDGNPEEGYCLAQVKSGKPSADALRAFLSQITGGKYSMGVFITLEKQKMTPTMREVVAKAGTFQPRGGAKTYERIVFWSIEEYFDGVEPQLPEMAHPLTGKPLAQKEIPTD